jgi:hypothetical protein
MKTLIAIVIAISVLIPTVNGTWITDVRWNANLKVIEISFDKFPANWGGWWMYVDEKAWPMEGGSGNVSVRPNAEIGKPLGFLLEPIPGFLAWKAQTSLAVALFDFIYLTTVTPTIFRTISLKRDAKRLRQKNVPQ